MSSCRAFRKRIPDALYRGLSGRRKERFDQHRDACTGCATEYAQAVRAVYLAGRRSRPDPGQAFWDGYWDRLQARLSREERREAPAAPAKDRVRSFPGFPRWLAMPAAAAVLLVAGILIGRFAVKPGPPAIPTPAGGPAQVVPAASGMDLAGRTSQYLDRSKRIILSIVNYRPASKDPYGLNLPGQRAASRDLVQQAAGLKGDLGRAKERSLERLVGDLEKILLQIANLESGGDLAAVDIIRAGAESTDILFEINLAELRGAKGSRAPAKAPAPRGRVSSM